MRARNARKVSGAIFGVAVALLFATLVLPTLKYPETASGSLPAVPGKTPSYQLVWYNIPPVQPGTLVNVTLSGFNPGSLEVSLSPLVGDSILPALYYVTVGNQSTYSFSTLVTHSYSLQIIVVSYNGTGYTVRYSGVWSPFSDLGVYTAPAVFVIIASGLAAYYYGTRIKREEAEEAVNRELRDEARQRGEARDLSSP